MKGILYCGWPIACLCLILTAFGCADSTKKGSYLVRGSFSSESGSVSGISCLLSNPEYGSYQVQSVADGTFAFSDIWNGAYTLTVSKAGCAINPSTVTVTVNGQDVTVTPFSICSTSSTVFGYSLNEKASAIISDGNGGYIVVGSSNSNPLATNVQGYVADFDATGKKLWDKWYGGNNYNTFSSIAKTSDGGYIIIGSTESSPPAPSSGISYLWLVKIDSSGNLDPSFNPIGSVPGEMCIGNTYGSYGAAVIQNTDGNYVVAGTVTNWISESDLTDMYVAIINPSGNVLSQQTYGNSMWGEAFALCEVFTPSGSPNGYVIAGTRETTLGNYDIDVLKVSPTLDSGAVWEQVIDHGSDDEAKSVAVLTDGTIAVTGFITAANGSTDIWTGLFSPAGALTNEIIGGGSSSDWGSQVLALPCGGFLVAGTTVNTGQNRGDKDYYLTGYSADGTLQWSSTYDSGSGRDDICVGVISAIDGYVMGGYTDHSDAGTGDDFWLLKVSLTGKFGGN